MLDKELVKTKFQKSMSTYCENAPVQMKMAEKLSNYLDKHYDNILEIGSYTGFLTHEIIKKTDFKTYTALDITDSFDYIKNLSPKIKFISGDIEQTELKEKYDLITSSSTLQWCVDFEGVIKKLKSYLKPEGHIIIAIFGKQNLYQIKNVFNTSLNYPEISEIRKIFSTKVNIIEETVTIQVNNPKEILKHLKYTGVNSLKVRLSYSELKEKMKILEEKYENKLTYNPLYIID